MPVHQGQPLHSLVHCPRWTNAKTTVVTHERAVYEHKSRGLLTGINSHHSELKLSQNSQTFFPSVPLNWLTCVHTVVPILGQWMGAGSEINTHSLNMYLHGRSTEQKRNSGIKQWDVLCTAHKTAQEGKAAGAFGGELHHELLRPTLLMPTTVLVPHHSTAELDCHYPTMSVTLPSNCLRPGQGILLHTCTHTYSCEVVGRRGCGCAMT